MILAIDQGTTGTTALLVNAQGGVAGRAYREISQHYPRPGWVEQDPEEIWQSVLACCRELTDRQGSAIHGLGITNQRETVVVWDRASLKPVAPAIVWQCRRTAEACTTLLQSGHEAEIRRRTGLVIDPYFSATKLQWLLNRDPELRQRADRGSICFGTVDSWLVARLTAGATHATDPSNASRTMLCGLNGRWDPDLLDLFAIPPAILPEIRPSSGNFGQTDPAAFLGMTLPIAGIAGDQQASLFGHTCFEPGMAKNTYGTGSFLLANTGSTPVPSNRALTTIAWDLGEGLTYALEGSVFISAAALQWLRDGIGIIAQASDAGPICEATPDTGGVFFVPALSGLGAPHWDPRARGLLIGLTGGTTRAHIVRAAVEAMAYQTLDVALAMEQDRGAPITQLRADGGASAMDFLLQFQADLLGTEILRAQDADATALGAAGLAGLHLGTWSSTEELAAAWREGQVFRPRAAPDWADGLHREWSRAVDRAREWVLPAHASDPGPGPAIGALRKQSP